MTAAALAVPLHRLLLLHVVLSAPVPAEKASLVQRITANQSLHRIFSLCLLRMVNRPVKSVNRQSQ